MTFHATQIQKDMVWALVVSIVCSPQKPMIWHAWNILEWFGSVAWAPFLEPEQGLGVFQILVTVANYSCPECFGISYLMEVTSFVFCPGAILKLTDSTVNMCFLKKKWIDSFEKLVPC